MTPPLVSVGMPVHNGAATMERALGSVLSQSHANLEIILSDNASTDGTAAIARRAAEHDPRIRYFRQPEGIGAWANYRFVLEQATGEYFLWAADDDLRSPNYVEAALAALSAHPEASLAVTDVVRFDAGTEPTKGHLVPSSSWTRPKPYARLLRRVILSNCSDFYGLFRTRYLREFPWMSFDYGHDHILLFYVGLRGDVVQAPGALFFESIRPAAKTRRQRVKEGFYRNMGRFRMVRFSWQLAKVACVAARHAETPVQALPVFAYSYFVLRATLLKVYLYEHAPGAAVRLWRRLKPAQMELEPTS